MRIWRVGACLVLLCTPSEAAIRSVKITEPRTFAYFVGDVIERRAEIHVDPQDEIEVASLPRTGQVNYWLDLNGVDVERSDGRGERRYSIRLVYQTFYVPLETRRLTLPPVALDFKTDGGSARASVPALSFTMAPLRELLPDKSAEGSGTGSTSASGLVLMPDVEPRHIDSRRETMALAVSGAVAALVLLVLCHIHAWFPFNRRPGRPFARAYRSIKSAEGRLGPNEEYREGIVAIHRALDEAAGRHVFADELGGFIGAHPAFDGLKDEMSRFFESSRRVFFAEDMRGAFVELPASDLRALAADLSRVERERS